MSTFDISMFSRLDKNTVLVCEVPVKAFHIQDDGGFVYANEVGDGFPAFFMFCVSDDTYVEVAIIGQSRHAMEWGYIRVRNPNGADHHTFKGQNWPEKFRTMLMSYVRQHWEYGKISRQVLGMLTHKQARQLDWEKQQAAARLEDS